MPMSHGVYQVKIKANVLMLEATGPFNLQYVNDLTTTMQREIEKMDDHWGQMTIFHNNSLFVPDALQKVKSSMYHRKENGLKYVAVVLLDPQCSFVIKEQISEIYQSAQIPFKFFDDYPTAESWLTTTLNKALIKPVKEP